MTQIADLVQPAPPLADVAAKLTAHLQQQLGLPENDAL